MLEEVMIQHRVMMIEEGMIQQRGKGRVNHCQPSTTQRGEEGQEQISQQAQHFRKVRYRFAAGAGFRKVRSKFRGRRSTFARGTNFAAGAALSQGTVQSLTQAQHFRKQ